MSGQKTALVFAGGGSLGAIQVGMLRVLLSTGLQPDFVIGSSVGAINAAYFAGTPSEAGVIKLAQIWSTLHRRDVFPFTFVRVVGLLRHPDYIVDPSRLRRLIERNLPYGRLEDATIPVHITATDMEGMAVLLSKGPSVDAILASAAIPGIFPPVRIDGQTLMDGAIATNTPIRAAADLGASRLIVLPTGYACSLKEPPKGAIARALHAITLLIEWQLIRDLERLGDEIYVCIVPTLCPLDVSPYDFSASHYLIERAAENTRKWLDRGGLSRRSSPQELQAHRH
ncbi:MAG TPA: patatin-like phospholipase family protein [Methylocella sp.]|nr:patatin-like phospholipase family protein [Methylocella sp.]